jgi:hypothetical protein
MSDQSPFPPQPQHPARGLFQGRQALPAGRQGALALVLLLAVAAVLLVSQLIRREKALEGRFDTNPVATGIMIADPLDTIYSHSGTIEAIQADMLVLRSNAVKDGEVVDQSYQVMLTENTLYREKRVPADGTEDGVLIKESLQVGDTVNVVSAADIKDQDAFAAARVERIISTL